MIIRVLFVDDEPRILRGLRRSLFGVEEEFEADFAESAAEALEMLAAKPYDVVVSDMRMPGMDGAELLHEVKSLYPHIVRIIMSGHSEQEAVLSTVGPTHQYLAKPCEAETLQKRLREVTSMRRFVQNEQLMEVINRIDTLPSMPNIYQQILTELQSDDTSMKRIGEIIASDPAMTAKILKLVNSAYFGISNPISSPFVASNLLGLETIKTLVLSLHIFSQMDDHAPAGFPLQPLLQHSLAIGATAQKLAKKISLNDIADDAFTAGLLHDVGKVVLAVNFPEEYRECLKTMTEEDRPIWQLEREHFGASHAEVAGYLFSLWGLPTSIVNAITHHHEPMSVTESRVSALTLLHIINAVFKPFSTQQRRAPQDALAQNYVNAIDNWERILQQAQRMTKAS